MLFTLIFMSVWLMSNTISWLLEEAIITWMWVTLTGRRRSCWWDNVGRWWKDFKELRFAPATFESEVLTHRWGKHFFNHVCNVCILYSSVRQILWFVIVWLSCNVSIIAILWYYCYRGPGIVHRNKSYWTVSYCIVPYCIILWVPLDSHHYLAGRGSWKTEPILSKL